jgi:hypothetical protein
MGRKIESDGNTYTSVFVLDQSTDELWTEDGGRLVPWHGKGFHISGGRIWLVDSKEGSPHTKDLDEDLEYIDLPGFSYGILKQTITPSSDGTDFQTEQGHTSCTQIEPITPESSAFEAAVAARTSAAYRSYLAAFPHGKHGADVRNRLADCKSVQQSVHRPLDLGDIQDTVFPQQGEYGETEAGAEIRAECEEKGGRVNSGIYIVSHHYDPDSGTWERTFTGHCQRDQIVNETVELCP